MTKPDFDPLDTEENAISRKSQSCRSLPATSAAAVDLASDSVATALVLLEAGKHGVGQSPSVMQQLPMLETAGLAEYSAKKGWRLTQSGKERARAFLAAARRLRRAEKGNVT